MLPALTGAQHPVDPSPSPANNPAGHVHLVCVPRVCLANIDYGSSRSYAQDDHNCSPDTLHMQIRGKPLSDIHALEDVPSTG